MENSTTSQMPLEEDSNKPLATINDNTEKIRMTPRSSSYLHASMKRISRTGSNLHLMFRDSAEKVHKVITRKRRKREKKGEIFLKVKKNCKNLFLLLDGESVNKK